jgi:Protein of unknown function (DUF1439)
MIASLYPSGRRQPLRLDLPFEMGAAFMRRLLLLAMIALLSACATLGGPRTVSITEEQLNRLIDERMNKSLTFLRLFDVAISNPRVSFEPNGNRVITSLDAAMLNPFSGNRLTGAAKISGKLSFDAQSNSVILADTRTEEFKLDGLPPQYANQVNAIGKMVAGEFLKDFTVYQLKPEDLKLNGVNYKPGGFEVKRGQLAITLTPQ